MKKEIPTFSELSPAYQIFDPDGRSNSPNVLSFVAQVRIKENGPWHDTGVASNTIEGVYDGLGAKGLPHKYWRIVIRCSGPK